MQTAFSEQGVADRVWILHAKMLARVVGFLQQTPKETPHPCPHSVWTRSPMNKDNCGNDISCVSSKSDSFWLKEEMFLITLCWRTVIKDRLEVKRSEHL